MHYLKPLFLIVTLALVAACTPAAKQSGHDNFTRYTDLAAGFAVDYPKSWKQWVSTKTGEFMFAASDAPGADHCWVFAERVDSAWLSGAEATLDSINIQLYLIKRHREAKNDRIVKDYRSPLGGHPAQHFSVYFDAPLVEAPVGGPPRQTFPFKTDVTITHVGSYPHARPFVIGCTGRQDVGGTAKLDLIINHMLTSFTPMR
jgi:hypothetical protein